MFFSKEHEPIHIHVRGKNGDAEFCLSGDHFELYESHNIKLQDLKRIERAIKENTDIIIKRWEEYFRSDND